MNVRLFFKIVGLSVLFFVSYGPLIPFVATGPLFFFFGLIGIWAGFPPAFLAGLTYGIFMCILLNKTSYFQVPSDKIRQFLSGFCLGAAAGVWGGLVGIFSGGILAAFLTPFLIKVWNTGKIFNLYQSKLSNGLFILLFLFCLVPIFIVCGGIIKSKNGSQDMLDLFKKTVRFEFFKS